MRENYPLDNLRVGSLRITGREGLPFWTIVHFIDKTISNHMKVTTIQRICELTAKGFSDQCFSIATNSVNVYQEYPLNENDFSNYISLASKEDSPEEFWQHIGRLKRPVVFFHNENQKIPLYDFTYEEALRVKYFSENSPFEAEFRGSNGSLEDLFLLKEGDNDVSQIDLINSQIRKSAENIESIARASQVINDPNTPIGVRINANRQLDILLKAQERLNHRIGVRVIELSE